MEINMENNRERVLAYSMAKVIDHESLSDVSGGMQLSNTQTFGPSGGIGQGADARIDVTVDW